MASRTPKGSESYFDDNKRGLKIVIRFMKRILACVVFVACILLINASHTFACKIMPPYYSKHNPNEFIFIGKVIGWIGPIPFKDERLKRYDKPTPREKGAFGLKVKVVESVQMPRESKDYFEVFPYIPGNRCEPVRLRDWEISERFPIGAEIRVIGVETTLHENDPSSEIVRIGSFRRYAVVVNLPPASLISKSFDLFDYREWTEIGQTKENLKEFNSNEYLPIYELKKDFIRLNESKTEAEKLAIFQRLLYYPHFWDFDLAAAAKNYLKDQARAKELGVKYEKIAIERVEGAKK